MEHGSDTAMLHAKFQNKFAIEFDIIDEEDFAALWFTSFR